MSTPRAKTHLDVSVDHVEKALLARAEQLTGAGQMDITAAIRKAQRIKGGSSVTVDVLGCALAEILAAEFRALAGELHNQ